MPKSSRVIASTSQGKLEGSLESGLFVFRGVPYAAPPVGELRWQPPQEPERWDGVRQALKYGPMAPQMVMPGLKDAEGPQSQSEDCLYLNIYSPGLDDRKRPVMLWLHGGAFAIGAGSNPNYRGTKLVQRGNLVLVTINYRLGALGFLNLKEITGGVIPATGNEGLLDQLAALQWVKANIAAFGGDPDNVTLIGESAGAMSTACLMTMPKARGLFHKVIIESALGALARPLKPAVAMAELFFKAAGIIPSETEKLRKLSAGQILEIQQKVAAQHPEITTPWMPVADGQVLPAMPLQALALGQAVRVPMLIGSNLDEFKFFARLHPALKNLDETGVLKELSRMLQPEKAAMVMAAYRRLKEERGEEATPFELLSAIKSDLLFRQIAYFIAESQAKNGLPAFNYLFTWKSPAARGTLGACHTLEVGFVFGTLEPVFCGTGPAVEKLAGEIQDAWSAFAATGNPGCESLGQWPQYGSARKTMILSENSHLEKAVYEAERKIWLKAGEIDLS